MSFRLLGIAAAAAVTTLATVAPAAAGCCGCPSAYGYYVQPRVVYVQPPCAAHYQRPVYVVNQGPTFTQPVPHAALPSPFIHHPVRPYPYGASTPHWDYYHYQYRRSLRGHFYRAPRRAYVAPMYRPHRAYVAPRVVHVPRRLAVPHRARPVYAPMYRHHGKSPAPYYGQTPRRRPYQP